MLWGVAGLGAGQSLLQALKGPYWLSIQPNTTNTGFSDLTSWRMNSSVVCSEVEYPRSCSGAQPSQLTTILNQSDTQFLDMVLDAGIWTIESSVCLPGDTAKYPWNYTTARQDFQEEIFVKINWTSIGDRKTQINSYHCSGRTTTGYFSLPNNRGAAMTYPFTYDRSRYLLSSAASQQNQSANITGSDSYSFTYHTPLQASALIYFSDLIPILDPSGYPLSQLSVPLPLTLFASQYYNNSGWSDPIQVPYWTYLQRFSDRAYLESALRFGMFLANKEYMLSQSAISPWMMPVDMGMEVTRVFISIPAITVISFLLVVQVVALLAMSIWSSRQAVWTEVFDSRAMFTLAQEVGRSHRAVGVGDFPGWIGDRRPEEAVGRLILGGKAELITGRTYNGMDTRAWGRGRGSGGWLSTELSDLPST